jgi:hypothetical protein
MISLEFLESHLTASPFVPFYFVLTAVSLAGSRPLITLIYPCMERMLGSGELE